MEEIRAYRQLNPRVTVSTFNNQNVLPGADVSLVLESMNLRSTDASFERSRIYRQANRYAINERKRVYRQENKDAIKERSRIYRQANRDAIKERNRIYRQANRDAILERGRINYQTNTYNNMAQRHVRENYTGLVMSREEFGQVCELSGLVCALSGVVLINGPFKAFQWSPDRIDTIKGYVVGNVRIVALELNVAPTYTPEILKEYAYKSSNDIARSFEQLRFIQTSELFAQTARKLLISANNHVSNMQNAATTINRRKLDENRSLMSLLVNDINSMFMDQRGQCYYSDISIYYSSRL